MGVNEQKTRCGAKALRRVFLFYNANVANSDELSQLSNRSVIMRRSIVLATLSIILFVSACGPSSEFVATQTSAAAAFTALAWTKTPTATFTPTSTETPRPTSTLTVTPRPTFPPNRVVTVSPDLRLYCRESFSTAERYRHLKILSPCEIASGVVATYGIFTGDGDYTFDLRLDDGQESFLNQANFAYRNGNLHIEIEPQEQRLLIDLPQTNMHIVVVGAWVYDETEAWNEIHPVWYWAKLP